MGVDVTIKNKQLFKKPLTVSDLTLGKYQCGVPDQYGRSSRKPGAGDLVIYDENRIGRGVVAFSWSGSVRNQIDLRLNSLSTYTDIDMFCEIVKNILCVWKAKKFEWDGVEYTEADLGNLIAEQKNTPNDVIEAMTAGVNAFVGEAEQSDDLTMRISCISSRAPIYIMPFRASLSTRSARMSFSATT